ncbi:MAG: flagellar hook-basal body protein [Actinobacteria bacterium]|nr:flagellar hook-basal body protein [Actinomycetota bacterium]
MTGIYSAAAGMTAQQTWLDAVANDLANVNTPGYHSQRVAFHDLVYDQTGAGVGAAAGTLGVTVGQGPLLQSTNPLDIAIEGDGYFQVKRPDGSTALTRNGQLQVDANGQIVTSSGNPLVPPITLPKGTAASDLAIGPDGTVTTSTGTKLGQIQLMTVAAPDQLQALGDGQFAVNASSGSPVKATGQIKQYFLEGSNVDVADALTNMIQAQRAYELSSRAVSTQDQLLQMANELRR